MLSIGNLSVNMSSPCFFPTQKQINSFPCQFLNLNNTNHSNNSCSSINSIDSSNDNSRSSTPDSTTSQETDNSTLSQQSSNTTLSSSSISSNNNLDKLSLLEENERLKIELSELQNIHCNDNMVKVCTSAMQDVEYYINETKKWKKLYEKISRKIEDDERKLLEERKKKRKFSHILFEFGCSNKIIRETQGDFEYSAEIKKYHVPKITKLRFQTEVYNIQDRVGYKEVEFTNSSDINLNINDLKIVDLKNPNLKIKFSIKKLNSSFGCIYDDDYARNNYHYNKSKHSCYKPRRGGSTNNFHHDNNIICPDEHFLICFEHPIKQQEGIHELSYRLFSNNKANTRRYKGNGYFGQKIDFDYEVRNYY